MKKIFENPNVRFGIVPGGDDEDIGAGTGQSGILPYACSFEDWEIMFFEDLDGDDDYDFDDYRIWWKNSGFTEDEWFVFNTEPLNPEP